MTFRRDCLVVELEVAQKYVKVESLLRVRKLLGGSELDSASVTSLVRTFVSNLTSFYSGSVAEGRQNK